MFESYLLKGLIMGFVFGVPAGVVGVLTIRNALSTGFWAGLVTGMGSSIADFIYATVCVFGLSLVSNFILNYQGLLGIVGSLIIIAFGLLHFRHQAPSNEHQPPSHRAYRIQLAGFFLPSFSISMMSPATILSFFVAFAAFSIPGNLGVTDGLQLIVGIFIGTLIWWVALSFTVTAFRRRVTDKIQKLLNIILGSLLILCGIIMLVNTIE